MFDLDYEQVPYDGTVSPDFKLANPTAFTSRNDFIKPPIAATSIALDQLSSPSAFDNSMDRDIYLANAQLIRQGILDYFRACTTGTVSAEALIGNSGSFKSKEQGIVGEEVLGGEGCLLGANELLSPAQRRSMAQNLVEFQELRGVFSELMGMVFPEIFQETVYLINALLEAKLERFKGLLNKDGEGLLPKVERFWGNEGEEEFFKGSWEVYEDRDYDEIRKFAAEGVEELAMRAYFSGKLHQLTLRDVSRGVELRSGVSVADKFATLAVHLSRNIFLSLAGIAQRQEQEEEIINQLSVSLVQGDLTVTPSKRIKRDFLDL